MPNAEKPPSSTSRPLKAWKVAVLANVKERNAPEHHAPDLPPDAGADFDYIETIDHIRRAIETDGHSTCFIPADANLPYALKDEKPDICFNIAEGLGGDAREAHIPALLELLRIPYTGSRVTANAISLDKTLTKHIWRDKGLPVAPFQEFITGKETLNPDLNYPLFVKPAREGTGMGVDEKAIVNNDAELRERSGYLIRTYKQPALVEAFLTGREFTIGVLGREDAKLFSRHPEWYENDGFHRFPILELDFSTSSTGIVYGLEAKSKAVGEEGGTTYLCPADVEPVLKQRLYDLALQAHLTLGGMDVSRSDVRLDSAGNPCLMEINTLPGLTPDYSDLCLQANAENIKYVDLILEILYLGASRWKLLSAR